MTHATCSRCQMVLVLVYIDGQHVLVCPRVTCEGHDETTTTQPPLTTGHGDGR